MLLHLCYVYPQKGLLDLRERYFMDDYSSEIEMTIAFPNELEETYIVEKRHAILQLADESHLQSFPLDAPEIVIGRANQADIAINDHYLSGKHARILVVHNFFYIEDLGSRNGTRAADLPDQIPPQVIKQRAEQLRTVAAEKKRAYLSRHAGSILKVLVQNFDASTGQCSGISRSYVPVTFPGSAEMLNTEQSIFGEAVVGGQIRGSRAPVQP